MRSGGCQASRGIYTTTDHPSEQVLSDRGVIADRIDETAMDAFLGIDVAFAKRKRLPVAAVRWDADVLMPWRLADRDAPAPPRGCGNVATLDDALLAGFADDVVKYLRELEHHFGFRIRRIGIDAPSDPRPDGIARRRAEVALDGRRISCFTTPSVSRVRDDSPEGERASGRRWSRGSFASREPAVDARRFRSLQSPASVVGVSRGVSAGDGRCCWARAPSTRLSQGALLRRYRRFPDTRVGRPANSNATHFADMSGDRLTTGWTPTWPLGWRLWSRQGARRSGHRRTTRSGSRTSELLLDPGQTTKRERGSTRGARTRSRKTR